MRTLGIVVLLTSALAFAQFKPPPFTSSSITPSATSNVVQSTTRAVALYVDPTGNDGNACTSSGTGACLTIQGALNKVPKMLRHGVTVTVAAGTYACFYLSGFTCDPSTQQSSGGIIVDGFAAFANSTLATGTATGTATAGSAGSGTTFGSLTDGAQTWTVNDLTGRFVTITGGTGAGQTRVISSNTATVITIVGTWTAPTGTSTYAIQDPGVNINTACAAPATPLSASSANAAAIFVNGNNCTFRGSVVVLRGLRVSNSSGGGIFYNDTAGGLVTLSQIRNTGLSQVGFQSGASTSGSLGNSSTRVDLTDVDIAGATSAGMIRPGPGSPTITRALMRSTNGVGIGLSMTNVSDDVQLLNSEVKATRTPISIGAGSLRSISGTRLDCDTSAGTAISIGTSAASNGLNAFAGVTSANITTCGVGVLAVGAAATGAVTTLTGSVATTGFSVSLGASIIYTQASTTMTAGTNEINLDSGGATSTFAGISVGSCLTTSGPLSKACAQ